MSDSYSSNIPVDTNGLDLVTQYSAAANAQAWVQNRGPDAVLIWFTSSTTLPTGGGYLLMPGETFGGTAAHIWAQALKGKASIAIGLV